MKGVKSYQGVLFLNPLNGSTMAKLTDRVGDLEQKTEALIVSNTLYLQDRKERNKKLDTMVSTVVKIDKEVSNLVTEIKGDGGLFKRVNNLENGEKNADEERDGIMLLIAKNKGKDARLVAFVFAFGIVLGFITDKIADYYEAQLKRRSPINTIYHKPFNYKGATKII